MAAPIDPPKGESTNGRRKRQQPLAPVGARSGDQVDRRLAPGRPLHSRGRRRHVVRPAALLEDARERQLLPRNRA